MDEIPFPWRELLEIFDLAPNPLESAGFWLNEARYSRLYSFPAKLDDFLFYLALPVPDINHKHALIVRPKLSEFSSKFRDLIAQFLWQNHHLISNQCIELVWARAEQYFTVSEDSQLFATLMSKRSVTHVNNKNNLPLDDSKVPIKRLHDDEEGESPHTKRARIDDIASTSTTSGSSGFCGEEFCVAVRCNDVAKMFSSLESLSILSLEGACDATLHDHVIDESFLTEACSRFLETSFDNISVLERFLKYPCLMFLKQVKKTSSRELIQRLVQLTKEHPRLVLDNLFISFVRQQHEISTVQANVILNITKQALAASFQLQLLRSFMSNKNLLESSFNPVLSLYLAFLSAPLHLEEDDQTAFVRFFEVHSQSASKCFSFAKLLLAFLKKHGHNLSAVHHELLSNVLDVNSTALKPACKAALSKCKKNG